MWKLKIINEEDYVDVDTFPTDVIVRKMNECGYKNFTLLVSDNLKGSEGEKFYAELACYK